MIRKCSNKDFGTINNIINEAAIVYKSVIPPDRWKEPYMPQEELEHEIKDGVVFWGFEDKGELIGVMGIQHVQDVTLIRHAYVRKGHQQKGIGGELLSFLYKQTDKPILIGTWADAFWAIEFYKKHGFRLVTPEEKNSLLKKYWSIPERQVETSVVLVNEKYNSL